MLAYVFWHRAATADGYEERLTAFHRALAAHPPDGFLGSRAFRLDAAPWLAGDGPPYEDWYLVDSWAALGALNAGAVSVGRAVAHDAVARLAAQGTAGIYAPVDLGSAASLATPGDTATADPDAAREVAWVAKPAGIAYPDFHAALARDATCAVWQRQMTLGPAGEYVVAGLAASWPAVRVRLVQVC